jgi:hypothetical protein
LFFAYVHILINQQRRCFKQDNALPIAGFKRDAKQSDCVKFILPVEGGDTD